MQGAVLCFVTFVHLFFLCFSSFEREKKIEIWMSRQDGGQEMIKLIKIRCMKFFLMGRKKNMVFLNQDEPSSQTEIVVFLFYFRFSHFQNVIKIFSCL